MRLDDVILKPKPKTSPVQDANSSSVSVSKKIRPTVKELLQQKREKQTKASVVETAQQPSSDGDGSDSSDSSSSDSSDSASDSASDAEDNGEENENGKEASGRGDSTEEVKLPSNLPPGLLTAIEDLKKEAASSEQGKCRFFSNEVNRLLLS